MASHDRTKKSDLIKKLTQKSRQFSFIQAYRLLCLILKEEGVSNFEETIRIRPRLSLDFPGTDVVNIEEKKDSTYQFDLTVTFLGLYGSSSPLPAYYTEMLLEEKEEDRSITRDFIDILNNSLYHLLFQGWSKYELGYKIIEEQDKVTIDRLYSLIGLKIKEFREKVKDHTSLLSYIGLLSQFPRSSTSLEVILKNILKIRNLEIIQCVFRWADIPKDQQLLLGDSNSTLGEDTYLGEKIKDRMGKFEIKVKISEFEEIMRILPSTTTYQKMVHIIDFYLDQPLKWDLVAEIKSNSTKPLTLGEPSCAYLGWNTWLNKSKEDKIEQICLVKN